MFGIVDIICMYYVSNILKSMTGIVDIISNISMMVAVWQLKVKTMNYIYDVGLQYMYQRKYT